MAIDPEKYKHLTSNNKDLKVDYRPLNFEKLIAAKAFRVTNQGDESGGFNKDPSKGFSLVSAYNDKSGTDSWPDNPAFHNVVKELMTQRPHDIGAHKYMQIIQSAKDMGLTDDDIYLRSPQRVMMPQGYKHGGNVALI